MQRGGRRGEITSNTSDAIVAVRHDGGLVEGSYNIKIKKHVVKPAQTSFSHYIINQNYDNMHYYILSYV